MQVSQCMSVRPVSLKKGYIVSWVSLTIFGKDTCVKIKLDPKVLMVIGSLCPISVHRRGDKRVEMGHRPQGGWSPLISSHMDVHSACSSIGQHEGGEEGGGVTDIQTKWTSISDEDKDIHSCARINKVRKRKKNTWKNSIAANVMNL